MEIIFNKFNEWTNYDELLAGLSPIDVIGKDIFDNYLRGTIPQLSSFQIGSIEKMVDKVHSIMDISIRVEKEIEINLINLTGLPQLRPYIEFLRETHLNAFQNIKHRLRYNMIRSTKIHFDDYEELPATYENAYSVTYEIFESLTPRDKLDVLNTGYGIGFNDDGSVSGFTRNLHSDPVSKYLSSIMGLLKIYDQTQEFIEGLSSEEVTYVVEDDTDQPYLIADRHRLLLLNDIGAFDFLKTKYMDPKTPQLTQGDFAKLISTIIGSKSKELRSDVGKLISEMADPKKKKTVQTEGATKAVRSYIASLGLPNQSDT